MKLFLSTPITASNKRYFPDDLLERLFSLGELRLNDTGRTLTREETMACLADVDIVLTHWGSVQYDAEMLAHAPNLKIIAHCAGTVAHIASEEAYAKGIVTLSANPVMAKYVAEWVLGAMISGIRRFLLYDGMMRIGEWRRSLDAADSLFDTEIGLVGLGTVGRELLTLLSPFGCTVRVFDPYLSADALAPWPFARMASFEEVMHAPIVSIHASQTPETYHMIDSRALSLMPDGGVLINSARGSLVDTEALIPELQSGRLFAVLDVFEEENRPQDARLLACRQNTLLQPHTAALPANAQMTRAIVEDLERYSRGESMRMCVGLEQYRRMTQE